MTSSSDKITETMQTNIPKPALFVLVCIAIIPTLTETMYSPALPKIALALGAADYLVELTVTIYLAGFSIGTLFWGQFSDRTGRRPAILKALSLYLAGGLLCFCAPNITVLMLARLLQGLGASAGSVLSQAITRDAFQGRARGSVFSLVGMSISIAPTLAPLVGGLTIDYTSWRVIFLILFFLGSMTWLACYTRLPETVTKNKQKIDALLPVLKRMLSDRKLLCYAGIIGISTGMCSSYFTEGAFYITKNLDYSPTFFGKTFLLLGASAVLGGYVSHRLHKHFSSGPIFQGAVKVVFTSSLLFGAQGLLIYCTHLTPLIILCMTLFNMVLLTFGRRITVTSALSLALVGYQNVTGTASSLLVCLYYGVTALATFGMALLHNGTLLPMPLYFCFLGILFFCISRLLHAQPSTKQPEAA